MKKRKFKVGDRVVHPNFGSGTIKGFNDKYIICVEFDHSFDDGHDGGGLCKAGHGCNCWKNELILEHKPSVSEPIVKEPKSKFKIGDRVVHVINGHGTIKNVYSSFCYAVEFDNYFNNGHTCDGLCKDGHGWNCWENELILEHKPIEPTIESIKEFKFKVGDRVVYKKLGSGTVKRVNKNKRNLFPLEVEFDKKFYGGHDCNGLCKDGHGYCCREVDLTLEEHKPSEPSEPIKPSEPSEPIKPSEPSEPSEPIKEPKFKKGDRVVHVENGSGIVKGFNGKYICRVEFDKKINGGHTCGGLCKAGHGWNCSEDNLTLEHKPSESTKPSEPIESIKEPKFKVGDRVVHKGYGSGIVKGFSKKGFDGKYIICRVEFDKKINGRHTCGGLCKAGHGWNCRKHELTLEEHKPSESIEPSKPNYQRFWNTGTPLTVIDYMPIIKHKPSESTKPNYQRFWNTNTPLTGIDYMPIINHKPSEPRKRDIEIGLGFRIPNKKKIILNCNN